MRRDGFALGLGLVTALGLQAGLPAAADPQAVSPAWPLDAPQVLTSSFGEYRSSRLHAGIDLGTGGRTGVPCRAVANGSVVRMRMSPFGYGKALYIQLEDGTLAVYAHLSRFAAPLAARARAEQHRRQRYSFDVQVAPGELPVRRGEIIAWSGQTGVGAPHLHYELRRGDVAINPQTAGFPVRDSIPPVIEAIAASPLDCWSHVEGGGATRELALAPAAAPCRVGGRIGFQMRAWDAATSRSYRAGLYRTELRIDGKVVYSSIQERFDYADNHLADLEYDQERLLEDGARAQLLYRQRGNRLPGREAPGAGEGVLFAPAAADTAGGLWFGLGPHQLEIEAADAAGNTTVRRAVIIAGPPPLAPDQQAAPGGEPLQLQLAGPPVWRRRFVEFDFESDRMVDLDLRTPGSPGAAYDIRQVGPRRYRVVLEVGSAEGEVQVGERGGSPAFSTRLRARAVRAGEAARIDELDPALRLDIPAGALLEDVAVRVQRAPPEDAALGDELLAAGPWLRVEPRTAALDAPVVVTLRDSTAVRRDRVGLFWVSRGGQVRLLSAERDASGALCGETRSLSFFAALADTTAPRLGPARVAGKRGRRLQFSIHDDGARLGEDAITATLDGAVAICEWDPEAGQVMIDLDASLTPGVHRLAVEATDQLGNRARRETRLQVP